MGGDQHARGTESALQRVVVVKGFLDIGNGLARRQSFDGLDTLAMRLHSVHQAGMNGLAVQQHEARAAHAHLAAEMRAGQFQLFAQEIRQRHARLDVTRHGLAVHFKGDRNTFAHA